MTMHPFLEKYGSLVIALVFATAIIGVTYIAKGTEYENAWLYIIALYFVANGLWDAYVLRKKKED